LAVLIGEEGSRVKLVLVCGPWGSGTTAAAGLLAELGLRGVEPYFHTNDPRTPNSFESIAFKNLLRRSVSEEHLSVREGCAAALHDDLVSFRHRLAEQSGPAAPPIFLKDCLAALVIEPICAVFDAKLVYLIRSIAEIEATRRRRGWHERFGARGAYVLYAAMFNALVRGDFPVLMMRYRHLVDDPATAADQLARFAGVEARPGLTAPSSVRRRSA
jgi:hypothetical protein